MAIAFDAASNLDAHAGTSHTQAHTCTGSNLLLLVGMRSISGDIVSGATYNGVAMTLQNKTQMQLNDWDYLFFLYAPTTGANNIVISSSSGTIYARAVSYSGVSQTGFPDAFQTGVA